MMIWPILTRATVPLGYKSVSLLNPKINRVSCQGGIAVLRGVRDATFPKAPRIPVWRRSAPAQDNILLIRMTWYGWHRTLMWKASFPPILERYLFAQIRPASSASEESCSYSLETKCTHKGNSSTPAFLRPKSKIRICHVSTIVF